MTLVRFLPPKARVHWLYNIRPRQILGRFAQPHAQKPTKPRWHYLYYLLAAFDLLTISASLYLNHSITAIHTRSVTIHQQWTNQLYLYAELDQLAAAVNAPVNDIVDSQNAMAESAEMAIALGRFNEQLAAIRHELKTKGDTAQATLLLKDLDALDDAMTLLVTEARQVFSDIRHNRSEQVGQRMAALASHYSQVNQTLKRLHEHVGEVQQQIFAQQRKETDALKQYETTIAAFIAIMIVSVTVYGHKLAQQVQASVQEREQAFQQLQQAEASLRAQTAQLEHSFYELQTMQTRLVESEKMSALGVMVAGVAHEINNPVNFIYGNLQHAEEYSRDLLALIHLYREQYPHPAESIQQTIDDIDLEFIQQDLPKLLSSMHIGTDRIREIVKSLRNFSRLDEAEFKAVDLHDGLDSTLMILNNRLKEQPDSPGITIVKDYGTLPLVDCYPGQLNQVFMNLLGNAIDALEESTPSLANGVSGANSGSPCAPSHTPHPTITIRTEVLPHNAVAIRIVDNGPGIPDHLRSKIFNPFFTTKSVGKGTGLGLSISYKIIVETHSGRLLCHSKPGQGTEFAIEVPISQPEPRPMPMTAIPLATASEKLTDA